MFSGWIEVGAVVRYTPSGNRKGPSFWCIPMLWSLILVVTGTTEGQETTDWRDFDICRDCSLNVQELVRVGDPNGPGSIEGDLLTFAWGPTAGYLLLEVMSPTVKIFGADGQFHRSIGRAGEGPGELTVAADAHEVTGTIVVLDVRSRKWLFFSVAGEYKAAKPFGFTAGKFVPVGNNRVVVFAIDRRPDVVGLPLHLVDLADGQPSLHFGANHAEWVASAPYARSVRSSVLNPRGTIWWGSLGSPAVQQWSLDGTLLRTIEGELPWFGEAREAWTSYDDPQPSPLFAGLAVDAGRRLWMLTVTPDPRWNKDEHLPGERPDLDRYHDVRLDVFDLANQRHLGQHVWDWGRAVLFDRGGEPMVAVLEYDSLMTPVVVVYKIAWR